MRFSKKTTYWRVWPPLAADSFSHFDGSLNLSLVPVKKPFCGSQIQPFLPQNIHKPSQGLDVEICVHSLLPVVDGGVDEALGIEGGNDHGHGVAGIPPWPIWGLVLHSGPTFNSGLGLWCVLGLHGCIHCENCFISAREWRWTAATNHCQTRTLSFFWALLKSLGTHFGHFF